MNTTEIVFILDRSGSMAGREEDTIGGFNSLLKKQRKEKGEALVSTVLFNGEVSLIHDRTDITKVPELTKADYFVGGSTSLLDAVGFSIKRISDKHKAGKKEDVPDRTLVVITTDGHENTSREYTYPKVRKLIENRRKKGWEFMFLGANIDAAAEAGRFGISRDMAVNFHNDAKGIRTNYDALNKVVRAYRLGSSPDDVRRNWKKSIEKDFESRK